MPAQIRAVGKPVQIINRLIVGEKWIELPSSLLFGAPENQYPYSAPRAITLEEAKASKWGALAAINGIEARVVKMNLKYSYEKTAVEVLED